MSPDEDPFRLAPRARARPRTAPDRAVLALSNGSDILFTDMAGRPRWSLPGYTRWIQWTP